MEKTNERNLRFQTEGEESSNTPKIKEVSVEDSEFSKQETPATATDGYVECLQSEIETLKDRLRLEENRTASALRGVACSNFGLREVTSKQQEAELQSKRV